MTGIKMSLPINSEEVSRKTIEALCYNRRHHVYDILSFLNVSIIFPKTLHHLWVWFILFLFQSRGILVVLFSPSCVNAVQGNQSRINKMRE